MIDQITNPPQRINGISISGFVLSSLLWLQNNPGATRKAVIRGTNNGYRVANRLYHARQSLLGDMVDAHLLILDKDNRLTLSPLGEAIVKGIDHGN